MAVRGADPIRLLERLCNAIAVSGDETEVREIVVAELADMADEVHVDALGNVLAVRRGRGRSSPRVMLSAHMDEPGFMIVADDGGGVFQFVTAGGIRPSYLGGKPVLVGTDHRPGVIGAPPVHLTKGKPGAEDGAENLRIDLGREGRAAVGERATFATKFRRSGDVILAKSIDNRIGVATLIELMQKAPRNLELWSAFTVQEEIGSRGAGVAARAIDPDIAIVVEATAARDLPEVGQTDSGAYNTRLGLGPAIYISDRATVYDGRLVDWLERTARRARVAIQRRQPGGGGTDGGGIQAALDGIPCAAVAVPNRYPHSPVSVALLTDWTATRRLLQASLRSITPAMVASLRAGRKRSGERPRREAARLTRR